MVLLPITTLFMAGCDFSGDFLFNDVDGIPEVYNITRQDGSPLVPAVITSREDVLRATIYGEMRPSTTSDLGGVTFTFLGTGGDVCIWVDPEVAAWNTAIQSSPSQFGRPWNYPDNPYDDGDIELTAGLSVFYTGSENRLGDFQVSYEDELGNEIGLQLRGCPNELTVRDEIPVNAGKGHPDWCTLSTAGQEGVSHTVVLQSYSTPVDDSRLGYGFLLAEGRCEDIYLVGSPGGGNAGAGIDPQEAECFIRGEAIEPLELDPDENNYQVYRGFEAVSADVWDRSLDFEDMFCAVSPDQETFVGRYCRQENRRINNLADERGEAVRCSWADLDVTDYDPLERCFCGDINDLPDARGFDREDEEDE